MKHRTVIEIICALLIFLFVYTGISKLYDRSFFEAQLHLYPFISDFSVMLSWLLPFVELFTALLLIIPKFRLTGLFISFILLFMFTTYLISMLITKSDLPCSCGGIIQSFSWTQHVIFNSCFIILTATGIIIYKRYYAQST